MFFTQTAQLLDVPEQAVLRWAREGELPSKTHAGEVQFRRGDIEAWAGRMGMRLRESSTDGRPAPNALANAIREGGLFVVHGPDSAEGVLTSIIEQCIDGQCGEPLPVSAADLVQSLLARERLASTAVGEGIAIPHPRQPIVDLPAPRVLVAHVAPPVDWNSLDKVPVQLVIVVLSCSLKGHLDMLARVAHALRAPTLRAALLSEPDLDNLCTAIEDWPE